MVPEIQVSGILRRMDKKVSVYALSSSEDGVTRYIGQTIQPLRRRIIGHRVEAKKFPYRPLSLWILNVLERGHKVSWRILDDDATWHVTEISTIKRYRDDGFDLVNSTDGGEGTVGRIYTPHTDEAKYRISKALKGKKKPEGFSEKASMRMKGRTIPQWMTPESKRKAAESRKGKMPPNLADIHKRMIGRPKSEGVKAKISATLAGRKQSAEAVEKRRASFKAFLAANPEAVERRRATLAAHRAVKMEKRLGLVG